MLLLQKFEISKQFVKFGPEVLDQLENLSLRNLAERLNTFTEKVGEEVRFFVTDAEQLAVKVPPMLTVIMGNAMVRLSAEVEAKVREIAKESPSGPPIPALIPVFDVCLPFDDPRANLGLWVPSRSLSSIDLFLERSNGKRNGSY